jgi:hypothetical protein
MILQRLQWLDWMSLEVVACWALGLAQLPVPTIWGSSLGAKTHTKALYKQCAGLRGVNG